MEQTKKLISGLVEKKSGERQPFFDYLASEGNKLSAEDYQTFKTQSFQLMQNLQTAAASRPRRRDVLPLPRATATITSESQKEGQLPVTTAGPSSSTTQSLYYTPSPMWFGKPPSLNLQMGEDTASQHNLSGYLSLPDLTNQASQSREQHQQPKQLVIQTPQPPPQP